MKFNKNEFGWKEKVSVNTDELVTKNDIPHYNEILITEISGADYKFLMSNLYFNMSVLNIDETKTYVSKNKININDDEEYTFKFVYNKEADTLMCEDNSIYIYNHKSYDGENFIEDENSAVITTMIATFDAGEGTEEANGYSRLYEIDKVELDGNCLSKDVNVPNSLTVGVRKGVIGLYSVAEGNKTTASGECSHAEGSLTTAGGHYSHAEGGGTTANGGYSHAEGSDTTASGYQSHAEGYGTTASGTNSHAEGESSNSISAVISDFYPSTSDDDILTAWNTNKFSLAKGTSSHVEGKDNLALGECSHAEGSNTTASGESSHAEGNYTVASGENSHAEGSYVEASGLYSHAEGVYTTASGLYSHAEGDETTASGESSHAEGDNTTASGNYSHAEGNWTIASGECSHAEGNSATAGGNYSHAEGIGTNASGKYSHAEGYYTKALGQYQHVQGKNNIEDSANTYAHIVGNGTSSGARSNAHTLDWNGNAWYSGKLSQEGTPTEDKDLATKKYVDENNQLCWLEDYEATGDRLQYADVNVSSLTSRVFYAFNFKKHPGVTTVRLLKSYDDGTIKSIINLGSTLEYMYLMNISSSIMKFYLKYATGIVSQCVCTFGNTSDECTFERTPMVLYAKNTYEYIPTTDYNPATKKYVDDKFIALDLMETVGTIPQSELQKCNNGTSRYVSSIDFDTLFSEPNNYMYYATYKDDTLIPIGYQSEYNRMVTRELDSVNGLEVIIGFNYGTHMMYPFNGGNDSIKAYTFTNDLIIKRCPILNVNEVATKKYVDDTIASQPQISFNESGELVVTINGVSKTFVPKQ